MGLNTIVFGEITLGRVLVWLGVLALLSLIVKIYKALFGKRKVNLQHTVYFVCRHCGWEGTVSKFGTRCPKCDAPTGDLADGPH
jgi:hypothetical protein